MSIRIGHGYDVHAFGPGDHVTLGGQRVPHEREVEPRVVAVLADEPVDDEPDGVHPLHAPPRQARVFVSE